MAVDPPDPNTWCMQDSAGRVLVHAGRQDMALISSLVSTIVSTAEFAFLWQDPYRIGRKGGCPGLSTFVLACSGLHCVMGVG